MQQNPFVVPTKHFAILIKFWLLKQNFLLGQQNFLSGQQQNFCFIHFFLSVPAPLSRYSQRYATDKRRSFKQRHSYAFPCFFHSNLYFLYGYLTRVLTIEQQTFH